MKNTSIKKNYNYICMCFSKFYVTNYLNQYTNVDTTFSPTYDADGNQTQIKTSTGIWNVTYNGENRPILFDNGMHSWAMEYDYMGRRISQSGRRKGSYDYSPCTNYLYNDYLLIEEHQFQPGPYGYDRTFGYLWDPIAGMASRPLMMLDYQNNSFFYTHDANKNITELVDDSGKIVTHYEYSPFGALTVSTASTANPFTFSSEYFDSSLGLIYYNYRHYNPTDGRWLSRDPIEEIGGFNLYGFIRNSIGKFFDYLGLKTITIRIEIPGVDKPKSPKEHPWGVTIYPTVETDHAWVAFNSDGDTMIAVGFYPEIIVISLDEYQKGVKGFCKDNSKHYYEYEVTFEVCDEKYDKAYEYAMKIQANPPQWGADFNCVDFVMKTMSEAGITLCSAQFKGGLKNLPSGFVKWLNEHGFGCYKTGGEKPGK